MLSGSRSVPGRRKPGKDRCKKRSNPGKIMSNSLGISSPNDAPALVTLVEAEGFA